MIVARPLFLTKALSKPDPRPRGDLEHDAARHSYGDRSPDGGGVDQEGGGNLHELCAVRQCTRSRVALTPQRQSCRRQFISPSNSSAAAAWRHRERADIAHNFPDRWGSARRYWFRYPDLR
jgi:hypothetical protein